MSRLIEKLDEGEHLQPSDDGYVVYWDSKGYLTAAHLREIADELDRRNKTWHEQVMRDVGIPMQDTGCTDFQPDWTMPLSEYARIQKESMPKIKPLVWVRDSSFSQTAKSTVGEFSCLDMGKEFDVFVDARLRELFDTEADAKAWCQQEYERRVRECLE